MDLRTFIAQSIQQIVGGIGDAQKGLTELGTNARINPAMVNETSRKQHAPPSAVEFDIALTVAHSNTNTQTDASSQTSGLISVVSADQGVSNELALSSKSRSEAVSRVKFSVMIAQPSDLTTFRSQTAFRSSQNEDERY